jgi:heparan-alpha-glucosaminide N-acetyltransferase
MGQSYARMLGHAGVRAVVLILLGIFLSSNWSSETNFTFVNVLTQMGLGYVFLFLLWNRPPPVQVTAAIGILAGYWALFAAHPLPAADFDYQAVGVEADWPLLSGFAAHWNKNVNAAAAFDLWFLNLFPRSAPFEFNSGGYQTLNFIPSLATMIFGLVAGELMRSERAPRSKLGWLLAAGLAGLTIGYALHATNLAPLVKRIWTPSWAIYSSGWCCLILAGFYAVVDLGGRRRWAFPLTVVGMNSIAMYMMSQLLKPWTRGALQTHLGKEYPRMFGETYAPIVEATAVVLVLWLFCYWLYRQKVFLRI